MSKFDSVNNFIKSVKGEFNKSWTGIDGECFSNNRFYVDGTCLCRIYRGFMFIPMNYLSPKCSLYAHELVICEHRLRVTLLFVPQWRSCDMRSHQFSKEDIINAFTIVINQLKNSNSIYNKSKLEDIKHTLKVINEKCFKIPPELITLTENILEKMKLAVSIKDNEIKKFIENNTYYDIVKKAYFDNTVDIQFKTTLRQYLNPTGEYAFLKFNEDEQRWYSSETLCGTPKAAMSLEEGWQFLQVFHNDGLKHGMKFGEYTIMKVTDGYIQISCNKYCRELFEALYNYMLGYLGNE